MADLKISQLNAGNPAQAADLIPIARNVSGTQTNFNVTASSLASLFPGGAYLNCSQFAGADWTLQVQACLAALQVINSVGGIADARGIPAGGAVGSVNPMGGTMPNSGLLLMGPGTYTINVPFVDHGDWSVEGVSVRGFAGQVGTTIQAGAGFQTTYATGTITINSTGAAATVTGSGTTWTSSMIGCAFYGANGAANSTNGIITAVGGATSLTLGFGLNIGTGAPGGSAYSIACPVHAHGSGGASAAGAQFGMVSTNINYDCNNVAGCIGDLNWYGQQGTYNKNVGVHNFNNIGFSLENQFQQSGPWDNMIVSAGSSCTSGTILVTVRGNGQDFRGITGISTSKGACAVQPTVGIDIEENNTQIINADIGGGVTGILIGGNATCPVACASVGRLANGVVVQGAYIEPGTVTTAIQISNNFGASDSTIISNIFNNGATNTLVDQDNGCTTTESRLGFYAVNRAGNIGYSTSSVSTCQPATTTANQYLTGSNCSSAASPAVCGSAAAGSVNIAAGSTTLTVNTTAVTANSQIILQADDTLNTKLGVTCNSTLATLVGGLAITARTPGSSFQITYNGTIIGNPLCLNYVITN